MTAGTWYVKTGRTAVNWGTDVSGGVAQVDIAKLVVGTVNEQWFLFARAGQAITTDQVTAAQAETTIGSVPAALLPSNGTAPGGNPLATSGLADHAVTIPKLSADVQNLVQTSSVTSTLTNAPLVGGWDHDLRPTTTATWQLPKPVPANMRPLTVKNNGTANVVISLASGDTINGVAASITVTPGEWARFVSNGSGAWTASGTYGQATTYASGIIAKPGDNLPAKFAAAAAAESDLFLLPGDYTLTAPVTWDATKHSVTGLGRVTITTSGMTSGYAFTVIGQAAGSSVYGFRQATHKFSGIEVVGPDTDATLLDCFYIGDSTNGSHVSFEHVKTFGFRDQYFLDINTWSLSFSHLIAGHAHRYIFNIDAGTNAGESYRFINCTFYSSKTAGGNGTAVYTAATGNADSHFYACSFDYNDVEIDHNSGNITLHGCHIENNSTASAMILLSRTGGQSRTLLSMHGTGLGPTEAAASARDHLIEVKSSSSGGVRVFAGGCQFGTFDKNVTVFKNLSASASNAVFRHEGGDLDNSGGGTRAASMGHATSLLVNGNFESNSFGAGQTTPGGWAKGGTFTCTIDTSLPRSDTMSAHIVGPGGTYNTFLSQMFPVIPGTEIIVTIWVNVTALTTGSIQPRLAWYLADRSTRTTITNVGSAFSASTSSWVPITTRAQVPQGQSFGYIDLFVVDFTGTAYCDDAVVTQL